MPEIKERIKEMRIRRGLTLLEVAERIGVKEATVQRYESGSIKNIKHETICKLAEVFACDPGYLMGWEDDPEGQSEDFSLLEKEIVYRYRAAPEGIQESVCKLLDIKYSEKKDASGSSADMLA